MEPLVLYIFLVLFNPIPICFFMFLLPSTPILHKSSFYVLNAHSVY